MLFECHITLNLSDKEIGEEVAKELHWKTSEIGRDPVLGKDSYFYLTTHENDYVRIYDKMKYTVSELDEHFGVRVVREKIELIMYDTKVKV